MSSNAEIDKSVKIYGPCFIGNNVVIEKNTVIELYTVISDNVKISSNVSVEKINSLREFKKRQQCKNNKYYSVFRHNNTGQYNIV
jgi:NDP-sugar pyrophosphorylase family protein